MKKSSIAILIIVLGAILAGGSYVLMHKSRKPDSTTSSSNTTSTVNNAVLVTKTNSTLGQYLAEPNGQALYTFSEDGSGKSNCTGSCLASWPAYQDNGSATNLPVGVGTIKRNDNGELQFTYNGMPLYTFTGDSNGQVTGNGVSNFTVARPTSTNGNGSNTSTNSNSSTSTGGYSW